MAASPARRLPLRLLVKLTQVAKTYTKRELKWYFQPGCVSVEKFTMKHPDVTLGVFPDPKYELPSAAGALQTLAMASLLTPDKIVDEGLRERVEAAQQRVSQVVANAVGVLDEFGIPETQIQELIDRRIRETATGLIGSA